MALATIGTAHPASRTEQMLRLGFRYRARTHDGRFEGVSYERVLSGMLRIAVLIDAAEAVTEPRRFAAPRWEIASRDIHGAFQLIAGGEAASVEDAAVEASARAVDAMALAMRIVEATGQFAAMLTNAGRTDANGQCAQGRPQ